MLLVVALGGNALLERGQSPDAETQRANVRAAVKPIAELAREHDLVITHGNGPQVEAACDFVMHTGKTAAIGALGDAVRIIDGEAGTAIGPDDELVFYA